MAVLSFTLPEEQEQFEEAAHGGEWKSVLQELAEWLHLQVKHGNASRASKMTYEMARVELYRLANESNLEL